MNHNGTRSCQFQYIRSFTCIVYMLCVQPLITKHSEEPIHCNINRLQLILCMRRKSNHHNYAQQITNGCSLLDAFCDICISSRLLSFNEVCWLLASFWQLLCVFSDTASSILLHQHALHSVFLGIFCLFAAANLKASSQTLLHLAILHSCNNAYVLYTDKNPIHIIVKRTWYMFISKLPKSFQVPGYDS